VVDLVVDAAVADQKKNKVHDFVELLLMEFVEVLFVILFVFVQLLLQFPH
jgi:hypothetical protein